MRGMARRAQRQQSVNSGIVVNNIKIQIYARMKAFVRLSTSTTPFWLLG
jgi:hypothetical protein